MASPGVASQVLKGLLANPDGLTSFGLGLLNAGAPHLGVPGNLGQALQGAQANFFNTQAARNQLLQQQLAIRSSLIRQQLLMQAASGLFGGGSTASGAAPTSVASSSATSGVQAAPAASGLSPQAAAQTAPTAASSVSASPAIAGAFPVQNQGSGLRRLQTSSAPVAAQSQQAVSQTAAQTSQPSTVPPPSASTEEVLDFYNKQLKSAELFSLAGAPDLTANIKAQADNDPRVLQARASATNALNVDYNNYLAALNGGNSELAGAFLKKFQNDAGLATTAAFSGILTFTDPRTDVTRIFDTRRGTVTEVNPNGQSQTMLIPGAAQSQSALAGAIKGAQTSAEQASERAFATGQAGVGPGGVAPRQAAPASAAGAAQPLSVRAQVAGQMLPGDVLAKNAGPPPSFQGRPTDAAIQFMKSSSEEDAKTLQRSQELAESSKQLVFNLQNALSFKNGVYVGPTASLRQAGLTAIAALGSLVGLPPPPALTDLQGINKYNTQIAGTATRALGAREAAQIFEFYRSSSPGIQLTSGAFDAISASMEGFARFMITRNEALQESSSKFGGGTNRFASWFDNHVDPKVFTIADNPAMTAKFGKQLNARSVAITLHYLPRADAVRVIKSINSYSPSLAQSIVHSDVPGFTGSGR